MNMSLEEVLDELKKQRNQENIEGMKRVGIACEKNLGVKLPVLRKIGKKIGKNHFLALQLWKSGYRETMILASIIEEPEKVTEKQMEEWVTSSNFSYWEIVDQTCMNLFYKTKFAYKKCFEWSRREEEFVKRAAFALISILAWKDKNAKNEDFEQFFPIIIKESTDERNNVKKAVNWALRQIRKRNLELNKQAIKVAKEIKKLNSKSSKWIASNALKELESNLLKQKLLEKERI
ncbi:MAG: DNA alkylation repair protein [Candidatus Heimdallarchaeaceae archaeon]